MAPLTPPTARDTDPAAAKRKFVSCLAKAASPNQVNLLFELYFYLSLEIPFLRLTARTNPHAMKRLFLLLSSFLLLNAVPAPKPALRPGKDFALFFAVSNYDQWDDLKNPISEAEAIAKDLRELYDFQTEVVRDPTKAEIQAKIEEYRKKTYADDAQLFIFFTGHGEYLENTREGFFIPKDAKRNDALQDSYLSYLRLQRWIETLPCKHILLAIDACFSGTFDDDIALKGEPGKRPEQNNWREQYISQALQYRSRLFMASGAKVRTPDKSAFAEQFLNALRSFGGDDRLVSSTELWGYVQRANPKPCVAKFGDHEAGGDFLLVMRADSTWMNKANVGITVSDNIDLSDWNIAKAKNTVEDYKEYLNRHPTGDFAEAANGKIAELERKTMDKTQPPPFNFIPAGPQNGTLKCVIELGATGCNVFVIKKDNQKNWKLEKSEFGVSLTKEGILTDEDIRATLKRSLSNLIEYGVNARDIHFVVSSGAKKTIEVERISNVLKRMKYSVNEITLQQEAQFALQATLPSAYRNMGFVVDMGSGRTKIAWSPNLSQETYGSKYYQENISDTTAYRDAVNKAKLVPRSLCTTAFIIGGVPYEFARQLRKGNERYTVLKYPAQYTPDGAKQTSGLNIYKAIADATGCKQFVFDWDANYCIGFLLSL